MILLLHNRYRLPGGEERAVDDLAWLIREHLGEDAEVLERDSAALGNRRAAAGLLRGGLAPEDVAHAVRRTRARVVHAHNVNPSFGWRALAAAREAGARVVLHLHNYRLVCAQGLCFTQGADCTRCHGRNTLPGVRLNCRGGSRAEAAVYARRPLAVAAPAGRARRRLRRPERLRPGPPARAGRPGRRPRARRRLGAARDRGRAPTRPAGRFVLAAGRLSPEKGFADAIDAARLAGLPLVIAGDGPQAAELRARAGGADVRFAGAIPPPSSPRCAANAAAAVVPSRYAEILPLAALEAMAAGLPVAAANAGGLGEVVPKEGLYPPGDAPASAQRLKALWRDTDAGERALAVVRERFTPEAIATQLRVIYDGSA